jgi:DNA polymerase III epsilon subunit-like protein
VAAEAEAQPEPKAASQFSSRRGAPGRAVDHQRDMAAPDQQPSLTYLVIDTETTGLPSGRDAEAKLRASSPGSIAAYDSARLVSVAWMEARRSDNVCLGEGCGLVRPEGFVIPAQAEAIHGISTARALSEGRPFSSVLSELIGPLRRCSAIVGHNVKFDVGVLRAELLRRAQWEGVPGHEGGWGAECEDGAPDTGSELMAEAERLLASKPMVCTMEMGRSMLGLRRNPRLGDLYKALFGSALQGAHDAAVDTLACYRCLCAMAPGLAFQPGEWTVVVGFQPGVPGQEAKPEPGQEAKSEPGQEAKPEPGQEAKPEPGQEAKPEASEEIAPPACRLLLEVLPEGRETSVTAPLHRATVSCSTWAQLCGMVRGARDWVASRYVGSVVTVVPARLRWGSQEFVA